jgi:hypothetical protein
MDQLQHYQVVPQQKDGSLWAFTTPYGWCENIMGSREAAQKIADATAAEDGAQASKSQQSKAE